MERLEKQIPGWKILEPPLGVGGFAKVYEIVKNDSFGTEEHAALKVISIPESSADITAHRDDGFDDASITAIYKSQVDEIASEFQLMSRLKGNSNIVSYEDHYLVPHKDDPGWDILIRMELLASLPDYYKNNFSNFSIDDDTVIKLGIDICKALELCEKNSIIHRDIKPQNIFINKNGDFKLGDFGIARVSDHTTKATKAGTYDYMAPEIYHGQKYNSNVDQYSLGLVMYWMLNERRTPFLLLPPAVPKAADNTTARNRRMNWETLPEPHHGSDRLKEIVLKACDPDPSKRYSNPTEMRKALEKISNVEWVPGVILLGGGKNRTYAVKKPSSVGSQETQPVDEFATEKAVADKGEATVLASAPVKKAKNKKKLVPIIAACAALVLISGSLALWQPWNSEKSGNETVGSSTEMSNTPSFNEETTENVPDIKIEADKQEEIPAPKTVQTVTLNKTQVSMILGQSDNLQATVLPIDAENKTVVWTAANPSIVSVQNGVITALKSGSTTITATAGGVSAQCMVSVMDREIESLKITRAASQKTYYIGDSFNASGLTAAATYNDGSTSDIPASSLNISYDFSSAGNASVKVEYGGKTDSMSVEVLSPSIDISKGSSGGNTIQLSATAKPGGNSITWSSSNTSIASISSSGIATAKSNGKVTFTAKINYNGVTYSDSITLTVNKNTNKTKDGIVESSTPLTTSDELVHLRTDETLTGYVYHHYCGYVNGDWNVDSCWVNNGSNHHTLERSSPLANGWIDGDRGGRANEVKVGPGCTYGSTAWWLDHCNYSYTYVYQKYRITTSYYFA